ncbi:MAG TPA: usg protein [Allosphingosinicella sp.]|nr:usg protein [Allosphingosinicella sp.]
MASREFLKQLQGYGLLTAEISYYMPDHPQLIQLFIWQEYDVAPKFPVLHDFLDHWRRDIEAALHSVRIAHQHLIRPAEWRAVDGVISIN